MLARVMMGITGWGLTGDLPATQACEGRPAGNRPEFLAPTITAAALIDTLGAAAKQRRRRDATAAFVAPDALVNDEVGCLHHADEAANVLFGMVDQRFLWRRPILLTTNKMLAVWGEVLHDADMAEVILDRVLERGAHRTLGGPSWRREHTPEIIDAEAEPPRASAG